MRDLFGVKAHRQKPPRERLMPWPLYVVVAITALGSCAYLLSNPSGLSNTRLFAAICLLLGLGNLYLAGRARQVRR